MTKRMLIDAAHPEEIRVVVVDGNKLDEFDHEVSTKKQLKGNIYLAKVTRVEPSLQAAFVSYGGNRHGFLAFAEIDPDYYRLPVADREALLAEQRRLDREAALREAAEDREHEENERSEAEDAEEAEIPPPEEVGSYIAGSGDDPGDHDGGNHDGGDDGNRDHDALGTDEEAVLPDTDGGSEFPLDSDPRYAAEAGRDQEDGEQHPGDGMGETAGQDAGRSGEPRVETLGGSDAMDEAEHRARPPLRRYKIQEVVKRGQVLLVQVVKEERGNKGAALTTFLSLAGRYCVLMPNSSRGGGVSRKITNPRDRRRLKTMMAELDVPEGMSVILRTAGMSRSKAEIKRDFEYLLRTWDQVREKTLESTAPSLIYEEGSLIKRAIRDLYMRDIDEVIVEGEEGYRAAKDFMKMLTPSHAKRVKQYRDETIPLFHRFQVEEQLDAIHSPMVTLPAGGTIVFDPTEALVAIDVNSGRSTRERNIEETALRTNLEAAEEIARQLRLRDLAGLVVIDFIDMEVNRNKQAVERKLKEAMRIDRARIQIGRISPFGLLELSRQRLRPSLHESITQVCPHCGGTGHVRSTESSALHALREIEREGVRRRSKEARIFVPDRVALYLLNQKRNDLAQIEARYGLRVVVETDDTLIAPNLRLERIKADHPLPAPVRAPEAAIDDDDDAEAEADPSDDSTLDDIVADEAADAPAAAQTAGQRPRSGDDDGGQRRRRRGRRGGRRRRRDDPERRDDPIAAATPSSAEAPADGGEAPEDEDWGVDERFRPYRFDTAAAGDAPEADTSEADTMETGGGQPSAGGEAATRKRRRRGRRGGRGRRRDKLPNEAAANPPAGGEPGFGQPGDGDNDTGGDTDSDIPHSARDLGGEETAGAGERTAAESYNGRHGEAVDTSPQSSQGDVPSLFSRRDDDVETAEVADRPDRSAHGIDGDTEPQNNARPRRSGWWNRST